MTEFRKLDAEVCELARDRRKMLARIAALLLEMKRRKGHVKLGFGSIADYARARLDWSAQKTCELIKLAERARELPQVRASFEEGEIPWTKLRTVAKVATPETEGEWLGRAARLSSRQLEIEAAREQGEEAPKVRVILELGAEQLADLEDAVRAFRRDRKEACSREDAIVALVRLGAGGGQLFSRGNFRTVLHRCPDCVRVTRETRDGPVDVSPTTAARAACDSDMVDARKPARIAHTIPPKVRRFVLARDHERCVVPGCSGRDWVEVHHIVPRAHGGDHDPRRLATLCPAHHSAVHDGSLKVLGEAPRLRFFAVDGVEIVPPGEQALSPAALGVLAMLSGAPLERDDLLDRSTLPVSRTLAAIAELDLAGVLRRAGVMIAGAG